MKCFATSVSFYGEKKLTPPPIPMSGEHPSSAVRDLLFNVFAAALYTCSGDVGAWTELIWLGIGTAGELL